MKVSKMTDEAMDGTMEVIAEEFGKLPTDDRREILTRFVDILDDLDDDDFFGTEGWKHAFGLEN